MAWFWFDIKVLWEFKESALGKKKPFHDTLRDTVVVYKCT